MKYVAHTMTNDRNGICMERLELGGEGDRLNETAESNTEYYERRLTKSSAANDEKL